MFEDILFKKKMSIAALSKASNVGYNYVYKIVKNQIDFERCGIGTAKKLADAMDMTLDEIYEYSHQYFTSKIYYKNQTGWKQYDFGCLNAELNKLLLIALEYHAAPEYASRSIETCQKVDLEIQNIEFNKLTDETKCIMVAILNQQKLLDDFIQWYPNLAQLKQQKPLKETLYLSDEQLVVFPSYTEMNIVY